ncbi:MAG TPA: neutral zinc metallopeptidase [Gemmatimonadaceae bacterium]
MNLSSYFRTRMGVLAFGAATLAPTPSHPVRVTASDVSASNEKIASAYASIADMWTKNFQQIGEQFDVPRIARYRSTAMTPCGVIREDNAEYCENDNTIYYDDVFVAGISKIVADSLHTDGDMAGIGIIAHETGHAVAMQLGHHSRNSYENESTADCLAGAFAKNADKQGELEKGDIDEAFYGMSLGGDPEPEATGNVRYDHMIQARLARQSHGTKDQRTQNFRDGLNGGAGACLDEFKNLAS